MQNSTVLVGIDHYSKVYKEAWKVKHQADLETAEQVVYDANLSGYLKDGDALNILYRLNGYL